MGTVETAHQRRLARTILAAIACTLVLFVLFASGPTLSFSVAQQQTTSPGPSPSTQYQIEFLNPSGTNFSKDVSNKMDKDERYHLVAWVNELPPNASVEFRYRQGTQEVTIATATQVGITDTFEHYWEIPDSIPEEANVRLIAVLFSGGEEKDRDETDASLNRSNPNPNNPADQTTPAYETVEIDYPINGGAWGLFTPRDKATAGTLNVTLSADATFVRVVYTVTPHGQEPQWITCGTESSEEATDGVRCTLRSQDEGPDVMAVGAVANESTALPGDDPTYSASSDESADAHRVVHYEQKPATLTIEPAALNAQQPGRCSDPITATLVDEFGVPLPNANIDVHAQGPNDQLAFESGHLAPQSAHTTEPARNCTANPPSAAGEQGDHNQPDNDIKHIESAGTDDAGKFTFRLFSTAGGNTQFTVWSDIDDDDRFCSAEKSANGSIGWDQSSGSVTGVPSETTSCPSPSPGSPSPGPTTASPSPSDSPSPDPRGCTVTGTNGSEELEGTEGNDVICGNGGNDIIKGLGGEDVLYGDAGRDDISGGGGDDAIFGGDDKDTLRGSGGDDDVAGEGHNDVLSGGSGHDDLDGGEGIDTIRGTGGSDRMNGGSGEDSLTGGNGPDEVFGGADSDALSGGKGRDRCVGGGGRDTFRSCERRRQ